MRSVARNVHSTWVLFGALAAVSALAAAPTPPQLQTLAKLGQNNVEALTKPEYAQSRCMLSPDFGADYVSVAVSRDRVFYSGDVLVSIAGENLDPTVKTTVRDVLSKHGPDETVAVKLKRAGADVTVNAKCTDAKAYYDLFLEASYAALKGDAAGCSDKMDQARQLHILAYAGNWLNLQCKLISQKITGAAIAQVYYDFQKQAIEELGSSSDALDQYRGSILSAIALLRKNQAGYLADDLKELFDKAVAKAQQGPTSAPAPTSAQAR